MPRFADRVKETTTTTGTGSITLLGAVSQFQSFNTAFGAISPILVAYAIVGQSGTDWEIGRGTFTASSTLSRDNVVNSSNAGALVNLAAGTKDVFVTPASDNVDNCNIGLIVAHSLGMAMP